MKRQSLRLTLCCLAFLLGLVLARRIALVSLPVCSLCAVGIVLATPRKGIVPTICAGVACGVLGICRGSLFMSHLADYQSLFRKPQVFTAIAENDAIYGKQGQLSFDVNHIKTSQQKLVGKIRVEGLGAPMVYRGDELQISGSLSPTKGSAQARVSFAKLAVVGRGHSPIDDFRRRFIAGLQSALPEPEASFGAGLLIGQRSTIPKEISDQLSVTGLTHLVAVSGYNLTIIIVAVRKILGKASKFQSTIAAAMLMLVFVLITGFSASIVRAALVSSLSLVAWYYGRRFKPLLLISFAAALTAGWNPYYLWSDIGWYLSFLAFFGVLLVAPYLVQLASRGRSPKTVGALLGETISAQALTLPIIMYIFGRVSLIGLVANALVVPLVPLAMLLTLFAGIGGMFGSVGGWIAWPASFLLTYMIDITGIFSRFPHAAVQHTISLATMIMAYVAIAIFTLILWRLWARKNYQNLVE